MTVAFDHLYNFEMEANGTVWDGGILEVSVNGSPFAQVPDSAFRAAGYQGRVDSGRKARTFWSQGAGKWS